MNKQKRYRRRHAKPGQLIAYYGRLPHNAPDVVYAWGGDGVNKRHGNLLAMIFGEKRVELLFGDECRANGGRLYRFGKTFLELLDEAGMDITTLKFSIERKRTEEEPK